MIMSRACSCALSYSSAGIIVNPRNPTGLARISSTRCLRALHVQTNAKMHARPTRARNRRHLLAHLQRLTLTLITRAPTTVTRVYVQFIYSHTYGHYTQKTVNLLNRGRAHTGAQQQKGDQGTRADVRPMHSHADLLQKVLVHQCVCVCAPAHAHGLAACLTPLCLCACRFARQARSLTVDTQTKPTTRH